MSESKHHCDMHNLCQNWPKVQLSAKLHSRSWLLSWKPVVMQHDFDAQASAQTWHLFLEQAPAVDACCTALPMFSGLPKSIVKAHDCGWQNPPEAVFGIIISRCLLSCGHVQQCCDSKNSVTGSLPAPSPHQLKAPVSRTHLKRIYSR